MPRPQTPLFRNPTRALARSILEEAIRRPADRGWALQGFGVLRLDVGGETCLHVWCPDLATPGAPTIHDHPWQFSSFVIAGIAENHRFEMLEALEADVPTAAEAEDGWRPYVCREVATSTPRATYWRSDRSVWLRRLGLERVRAGSWYHQTRAEIHESRPAAGTVTLVQRHRDGDRTAHLFLEPGKPWVSGNKRPATDAEVVHACEGAVKRWLS